MNWGYKILCVYVVFVAGISFLVYKSSSQKMDLVTTDYYAKELKYQQRIDETSRGNSLSGPVKYSVKNDGVDILLPGEFSGKTVSGDMVLYCPADEDKDVKQHFSTQGTAISLPVHGIKKGYYNLQLSWQADGVSYYFEAKVHI
jgi:hypothetical protein